MNKFLNLEEYFKWISDNGFFIFDNILMTHNLTDDGNIKIKNKKKQKICILIETKNTSYHFQLKEPYYIGLVQFNNQYCWINSIYKLETLEEEMSKQCYKKKENLGNKILWRVFLSFFLFIFFFLSIIIAVKNHDKNYFHKQVQTYCDCVKLYVKEQKFTKKKKHVRLKKK